LLSETEKEIQAGKDELAYALQDTYGALKDLNPSRPLKESVHLLREYVRAKVMARTRLVYDALQDEKVTILG